jgi:hypothetical protein
MPRNAQGTLFLPLASLIPDVIPPTRQHSPPTRRTRIAAMIDVIVRTMSPEAHNEMLTPP